ncbi:copia protein [Nephila pilipes]|uniref:Copia protein n=1 Tax=Nephila pilipes TaxID=299642 RepID=A0A8X6QWF1_NEPPI|nr:copia protein [Nephila pilipes]
MAKLGTIRTVLSIAAEERMHLTQFDESTVFLYGDLEKTICMQQPGFKDDTERVCKIKLNLYGLKRSPRCWNKCFGQFLTNLGFRASEAYPYPCLYIYERKSKKILIVLYIDDRLIAATDQQDSEMFIKKLKAKFKISVEVSCFLGLEIEQHRDNSITISQKEYAKKLLQRFEFDECKPVATPMLKDSGFQKSDFPYRQAVGALMYLMVGTKSDLAYSAGFLSISLEYPSTEDIRFGFWWIYQNKSINLRICYAGGAIFGRSQRQAMVATSTTEAEAIRGSLRNNLALQTDSGDSEILTPQVDNRAAVNLSHNLEYLRRSKHIEIKHFFVCESLGREN